MAKCYAVYRTNSDEPIGFSRSLRMANELARESDEDEAAYYGCKVDELSSRAFVRDEGDDED